MLAFALSWVELSIFTMVGGGKNFPFFCAPTAPEVYSILPTPMDVGLSILTKI